MFLFGRIQFQGNLAQPSSSQHRILGKGILYSLQMIAILMLLWSASIGDSLLFSLTIAFSMLIAVYSAFFDSLLPRLIWGRLVYQSGMISGRVSPRSPRQMIAEKAADELMEKIENCRHQPIERQTYRRQLKALICDECCPAATRRRVLKRHNYLES